MKKTTFGLSMLVVVAMTACGDNRNNHREDHRDSVPPVIYDTPIDDTLSIDSVTDSIPPGPTSSRVPLN